MPAKKTFSHVIKRGDKYHYHRRVPQAVIDQAAAWQGAFRGQKIYRKTLDTSGYAEALQRASSEERHFDALVMRALTGKTPLATLPVAARQINAVELAVISQLVRDNLVKSWRTTIKRAVVDEEAADYLHWRTENEITDREEQQRVGTLNLGADRAEAAQINRGWGFHLDENSDDFAELIMAVRDGRTQGDRDVADLFAGKSLPDTPSSTLIANFSPKAKSAANSPTFMAVVADQKKVSGFAQKTLQKGRRAHQLFISLVGDKPVHLISRDDIHRFAEAVAKQQVGNRDGRVVTQATVGSYLTQIRSPLNHAVDRNWILSNPAAGVKPKNWAAPSDPVKKPPKRPFKVGELNQLFEHPWFAGCASDRSSYRPGAVMIEDMRYWAPVVSLYTGARASELGGLKLCEIILGPCPHITIQPNEYRRTKSGKSRIIPVLDALLELGFSEYYERVSILGSDRLFPDWDCPQDRTLNEEEELSRWANSRWIRAFNRTVIPKVFPHQNSKAERSPITFHSFRGSFKTLLIGSGAEKKANAVIGHSETKLDKAYLSEMTPEDLHGEFSDANYTGLVLPRRRTAASAS